MVCVIDNDPGGSAEPIVHKSLRGWPPDRTLAYVNEERPGIAAARNRGLEWADSMDADWIVFVDDDEWVTDGWLRALLVHANNSGADIVTGHVQTLVPADVPDWVHRGGFYQRTPRQLGSTDWTTASNNTLMNVATWRSLGHMRFDDTFSRTGGSDTDFFYRMKQSGASIEFTPEAVVFEDVPPERLNVSWLIRRGYRSGYVNGLISRRTTPRVRVIARGLGYVVVGTAAMPTDLIHQRAIRSRTLTRICFGVGLVGSVLQIRWEEYRRAE